MAARRRAKGEGCISRRKNGRWYGVIEMGVGPDGKRRRKWLTGKTKAEVSRKMLAERKDGAPVRRRITTGDYLGEWLCQPGRSWRPSTREGYRRQVEDYLSPRIGHIPLQKLTAPQIVEAFETIPPGARVFSFTVLAMALGAAVRAGLLKSNPTDAVEKNQRPRTGDQTVSFLTEEQISRLLRAAEGYRLYSFWYVAIYSGLRPGELVALRRSDIDMARCVIRVTRTVSEVARKFHEGLPKTRRSRRAVTLPGHCAPVLQRQYEMLALEGYDGELVFPNERGGYLHRSSIGQQLHRALERAGLPRIRPYDLRHTHASLLLAKGISPKVVSERLGHASVAITLDRYSHIIEGLQQQAADVLHKL